MADMIFLVVFWLFVALGPIGIFLAFLIAFPEKIEKIVAMFMAFFRGVSRVFGFLGKKYVKHDLQARVNDFVRRLREDVPGIGSEKLRVEWADPSSDRSSFLADGKVVIRLREDDPRDFNFVHGAFFYVSTALLEKPKRYLSVSQRESLDLYVCGKLIEEEKPSVKSYFIDQYLFPKTKEGKSKINEYLDDFEILAEGKLFFPTFLQELEYLGEKVFGKRENERIRQEVNDLIRFLKPIALRKVGSANDLEYFGEYCRFGIMFVGKPLKLMDSLEPYRKYFEAKFTESVTETVYLIGLKENEAKLEELAAMFSSEYQVARKKRFEKNLYYENGSVRSVAQSLLVLRRLDTPIIRSARQRGVVTVQ